MNAANFKSASIFRLDDNSKQLTFRTWEEESRQTIVREIRAAVSRVVVNKLQAVMLKDVPVIPVTESVDWYQYSTANFTGWVTESNPYAQPAPYSYPDWGQMLARLAAK